MKLVVDRLEFEEPSEDAPLLRRTAFDAGARALRAMSDDATPAELEAQLASAIDRPLNEVRAKLYADHPSHRRVLSFDVLDARALLDRYNLAQVQGLVLRASRVTVRAKSPELLRVRRLLRWLKFCRLVAEVSSRENEWSIAVEGPAAILGMQKKYGLQLAQFVAVVPVLGRWELEAEIEFGRGRPAQLRLDHTSPLVSPHERALGWVPEEVDVIAKKLAADPGPWTLDLTPLPRRVGASGLCVPDFSFRHASGAELFVEIFHRWHRHQLGRRLDELATRPDAALVLAVEAPLLSDQALRARVEAHPQAFTFKGFPSERKLRAMVAQRGS